jgi:hypothetical protein
LRVIRKLFHNKCLQRMFFVPALLKTPLKLVLSDRRL